MCGDRGTREGRPIARDRGVVQSYMEESPGQSELHGTIFSTPAREITYDEEDIEVVQSRMEYRWRGHVFRVGDRSGSYRIIRIDEDYRGVVTLQTERIGPGPGPRYMHESAQSWLIRIATHGVVQATRAVYRAAVAETRGFIAVGEMLFPIGAVVSRSVWTTTILHSYQDRINRVLNDVAELNRILSWLHEHAPTSVEVFLAGQLRARVDAAAPSPMNVTDISRLLTRTLRDVNSFANFIRFLQSSGSSIRAITRVRGFSASTVMLVRFVSGTARFLLRGPIFERIRLIQSFRRIISGATALSRLRRRGLATLDRERRAQIIDLVSQWARDNGITTRDGVIDRLIRENSNPRVADNIIQVLNIVRDTLVLCTNMSDDISMERASGSGRRRSEAR
jgi:hypothetical protein